MTRLSLFLLYSLMIPTFCGAASLKVGNFSESGLDGWREKRFVGATDYRIVEDGAVKVLQATSKASASGLLYDVEYSPEDYPVITWRWKVDDIVPGGDSRKKEADDYAARIYVIFPHWFFPKTRTLNYIWANRLPKDSFQLSTYTGNDMMIAVQSGPEAAGRWVSERRNIVDDYRKAFAEEPPEVGIIAIMTDTDNTGASAVGWYGDIIAEQE